MRRDLEVLFISKVRVGLLKVFFTHPDVPYFLRELVRVTREEINSVRRELLKFADIGLVTTETKGVKIYYTLNPSYTLYPELMRLVFKSFGLGAELIRSSKVIGNIKYAFLTSTYTRGIKRADQDVDLVIVGEINMKELEEAIKRAEKEDSKPVNYTVLKPFEFDTRRKRKDPFILSSILGSKVMLIGDEDEMVIE